MPYRFDAGGHSESSEVARIRAMLDNMPRKAHHVPPSDSDRTVSLPGPCAPSHDMAQGEDVVIQCAQDNSACGSTFRQRSKTVSFSLDHSGKSETIQLPRSVARKLGKAPHRFASEGALHSHLDELCSQTAFERVVDALGTRERSSSELERRLVGEGFTHEQAHRAIERARACGLCDDARFAESFISAKRAAGWGRSRIERELGEEGICPNDVLDNYPDAYFDKDDERERARCLLLKKSVPEKNPVEKLARFLTTKGYSASLSLSMARERVYGDDN